MLSGAAVARGDLDAKHALDKWPGNIDTEKDRLIRSAWHDLSQYYADADIRARDTEYAEDQKEMLLNDANQIRRKYEIN